MGRLEKLKSFGKMVSSFFNETDKDRKVKNISLREINEFFNKNPQRWRRQEGDGRCRGDGARDP